MRRLALVPTLALAACPSLHTLPEEQACVEIGYAIADRTYACTSDPDLANERYLAFEDAYDCLDLPDAVIVTSPTGGGTFVGGTDGEPLPVQPADYFHCAFAIRQLPCELVETYGDDLAQYLTASDACPWLVAPAGGAP